MSNELAMVKKDVINVVEDKVKAFKDSGELHFPAGYSPENAMKSAWLQLQDVKDRNNKPALTNCTKNSIANALLDMVVQGLNPAKKQGYFIVYGQTLTFQRSYFGTMAVTKRLTGAKAIDAMTIHEGDKLTYDIVAGRYKNLKHEQEFGSTSKPIIGAYCTIIESNGEEFTELMTMDEIKASWGQSKMNASSPTSTHSKFPVEMAKKTITNRACKRFLNSSDDSSLLFNQIQENDRRIVEAEAKEEIAEHANQGETLDIDFEDVQDTPEANETQEEPEYAHVGVDAETGEVLKDHEPKKSVYDEDGPPF